MRKILLGLACVGGVLLACSSDPSGNGSGCGGTGGITITASDNLTFTPQSATGTVGQQICFQNKGSILHDIIPDSVNSGDSAWAHSGEYPLAPGLPNTLGLGAGTYYYHCKYHGSKQAGMWGVINVR